MTTLVSVVAAVAESDGRYLVCLRPRHKRHGGLWEFPGGKVEGSETLVDAIHRELLEELGLRDVSVGETLWSERDDGGKFLIHFISVKFKGTPIAYEHEDIAWCKATELQQLNLAPSDQRFSAKCLNDAPA